MENGVWILLSILGLYVAGQLASIVRSLQATEVMLHRLLVHQGVEWQVASEPSGQVEELAADKKTYVAAIRAYRQQTGLGLKEAKAVVDGLVHR